MIRIYIKLGRTFLDTWVALFFFYESFKYKSILARYDCKAIESLFILPKKFFFFFPKLFQFDFYLVYHTDFLINR